MGDIAVRVENLSKLYRIGAKQEGYKTFRDSITDALTAPFKRVAGLLRGNAAAAANLNETIWALKDVSFEVKKGEVVGIIGRNGAGKSTLLKILSRITEPTSGEAKVYGRVGALLEVGTGFHPELTGRENIYLNGAILGMSREEIKRKFDEIVAFAEVEKFIDTPVKHYSSGMGLRLGFAVAAHLEPEILIVDEVLAVGDAAFQKKCLGKMGEVAGEGRTVLFVSHNMAAVIELCQKCVLLKDGNVDLFGDMELIANEYLRQSSKIQPINSITRNVHPNTPMIENVRLSNGSKITNIIETNTTLCIEVKCSTGNELTKHFSVGIVVTDTAGSRVFVSHFNQYKTYSLRSPHVVFTAIIPTVPLNAGLYRLSLHLSDETRDYDVKKDVTEFEVLWNKDIDINYAPRKNWGTVFIPVTWSAEDYHGND